MLASDQPHAELTQGQRRSRGKIVFVFPGQGSQWATMGAELLRDSAAFRQAVDACDAALKPWVSYSVLSVLRGDPEPGELIPPGQARLVAEEAGQARHLLHSVTTSRHPTRVAPTAGPRCCRRWVLGTTRRRELEMSNVVRRIPHGFDICDNGHGGV